MKGNTNILSGRIWVALAAVFGLTVVVILVWPWQQEELRPPLPDRTNSAEEERKQEPEPSQRAEITENTESPKAPTKQVRISDEQRSPPERIEADRSANLIEDAEPNQRVRAERKDEPVSTGTPQITEGPQPHSDLLEDISHTLSQTDIPEADEPAVTPPSDSETASEEPVAVAKLRSDILDGPYGKIPIRDLVTRSLETRDPTRWKMYLAMALRKEESLPAVIERLQQGSRKEKIRAITLVSLLQWREAAPDLMEILSDKDEPDIVRVGACYALGELRMARAGLLLVTELENAHSVQMRRAALLALGNLQDPKHTRSAEAHLQDEDDYVRLYAEVALARMGESKEGPQIAIDLSFSDDWKIRSEAIRALAAIGGDSALQRLEGIAATHDLPGVRKAAERAIERAKLIGMSRPEALDYIRAKLKEGNVETQLWVMKTAVRRFGGAGLEMLRDKVQADTEPGQMAALYYIAHTEAQTTTGK